MRPVRLEFCGVNSFSEVQKIDFEELLRYGLFGIFGDTGSGKSTILDCIGFALYGEVTRSRSGKIADIINYEKDKAYVHFEFETDYAGARRRYRVERELKRKNAAQSLKVYEFDGEQGVYLCIADAVRQGNELLEKIIGLEQKDYEKCIALPQGEFAQFVKAARSDRLKLVSRLFDLERYGERLVTRANAAFREAATAVELSKARLLPYESYTKEGVEQIKKEIKTLSGEAEAYKKKLAKLKEKEKAVSALLEKSKEAKTFYEKLEKLKEELPRTERIEKELGLLASATAAQRADEEYAVAKSEALKAAEALRSAQERLFSARRAEESAKSFDGEKAEAEIALLTAQRALAQEREKQESRLKELKEKLFASRQTYKELKSGFAEFDYEKEKQKIEERIASLTKADGFEKAAFFRGEYLTFKNELEDVEKKFPQTEEEIEPLIQKYAALSTGEERDFSLWERHNAEREKQLSAANEALFSLEQKYGDYKAHLIKLKSVEEEGQRIKREIEELDRSLGASLSVAETERRLARLKEEIKEQAEIKERAAKALSSAEADVAVAVERERADKKTLAEAEKRRSDALKAGGFSEIASARALCEKYGDGVVAKERAAKFREEYASAKAGYETLKDVLLFDAQEAEALQGKLKEAEKASEECVTALALKRDGLVRAEEALKIKRAFEEELSAAEREKSVCEQLKKLLEGNKFMEFVAEEYLTSVAEGASGRLLTLTNGQYFLRYDGGFFVGDNLHGGALRGVNTLSGGETFLVSLSLALSLSQEICARNLRASEFFFLDEGFGTLDAKLVDTVMDSLEKLRGERFSIGIISHVEELKHRINRKLTVKKATEKHGSQIIAE